jgi:methylthioribose-1-phosphate isomerase
VAGIRGAVDVLVDGVETRSIREVTGPEGPVVEIIDQTALPHRVRRVTLRTAEEAAGAIRDMWVRGAPLIGVTAAYGLALACREDRSDEGLEAAAGRLLDTRPTAVNLRWAIRELLANLRALQPGEREEAAFASARRLAEEDVERCRAIGRHGGAVLKTLARGADRDGPLQVLTHCNAGWLAAVDWGTALAPVYRAHRDGLSVHLWVSETRPRNQGASLTAWELREEGVAHTVIADNASGHLLRTGRVDAVITGTDRTTAAGDVCNKIGTYLKAVAAYDSGVPFYAAVPGPSIDWEIGEGQADRIPIEERDPSEVTEVRGLAPDQRISAVRITPSRTAAFNPGFDVTPARLITGLITERGLCDASTGALRALYPSP